MYIELLTMVYQPASITFGATGPGGQRVPSSADRSASGRLLSSGDPTVGAASSPCDNGEDVYVYI